MIITNKTYQNNIITAMMTIIAAAFLCCLMPTKISAQKKETQFTSVTSSVYGLSSKLCKTDEAYISEGDNFGKICPGSGKYKLLLTGSDYRINYGAVVPKTDFVIYFHALETGAAEKFARADLYDEKIGAQIEWRLANGVPFAVIVRMNFFKNTGGAKTFANPKNKKGEFVFVRGLKGFEDLQEDLDAIKTAYDPLEQAHKIADEFYGRSQK